MLQQHVFAGCENVDGIIGAGQRVERFDSVHWFVGGEVRAVDGEPTADETAGNVIRELQLVGAAEVGSHYIKCRAGAAVALQSQEGERGGTAALGGLHDG